VDLSRVFGWDSSLAEIVLRCVLIYIAVIAGMRLTGRRQLGQMTPFDLVLILLIANAVQNAMVGPNNSILGGLVAAATLLTLNQAVGMVLSRAPLLRLAIEGEPVLIVHDGKLLEDQVRREGLTDALVMQAMREHGFDELAHVHSAVLEIDGTISFTVAGTPTVPTRRRVRTIRPGGN
jgi:uncharacterized membrane protein YcaP (DUF421 family)